MERATERGRLAQAWAHARRQAREWLAMWLLYGVARLTSRDMTPGELSALHLLIRRGA